MSNALVMSVTDELVAELERSVECVWPETDHTVTTLRVLLAERAELKLDAERYREFRKVLIASGWTEQQADEYVDRSIA